jgi:phenylalanyl-tRNA synthetase alpha chain
VAVVSESAPGDLPPAARERLGITEGQKNVLVRVVLRRLDRALVRDEANALRDAVHRSIHEGA